MIKKINVNKSDEAALIVEKILESESDEVVLIIPRFSTIGESLSNLHLLKREAEAMGKKIFIESVDNRIIELAELAGVEAINPFFVKNKKQFSDIIPKKEKTSIKKSKVSVETRIEKETEKETEKEIPPKEIDEEYSYIQTLTRNIGYSKNETEREQVRPNFSDSEQMAEVDGGGMAFFKKMPLKLILGIITLTVIVYAAATILPKADLKIVTKKIDWSYNDSVITQISAKSDYKTVTIPNQKFTSTKNTTMSFPATGKKQVSNKAVGVITIYNSYSSDAQTLIQNTRFLSPDGKIFLLTKKIIVPGAKISEGKIIPSSIDANVIAEKAGEEYNVGPVKLFSIPGFKGTPKYQAFYGESKNSMSGGFVGEVLYPTSSDIADATKKIKENLQSVLDTILRAQISSDFKILDGASSFSITKQTNNTDIDKDGNFSILAEAQYTIIAFKEADLLEVLKQKSEEENNNIYEVKSHTLEYGIARMDTASGRMSFPVTYKSVLSYKIDANKLKIDILGKNETDLKKIIFSLPGLDTVNISLWPFWVKKVPTNQNKVNIAVD